MAVGFFFNKLLYLDSISFGPLKELMHYKAGSSRTCLLIARYRYTFRVSTFRYRLNCALLHIH